MSLAACLDREVLEALMRDSSMLDDRVPSTGEKRHVKIPLVLVNSPHT